MLTLFTIPKPFAGHIEIIQHNAIQSWVRLHPEVEVILFGDEEGTAEVAQELGVRHVPEVERNEYGTPLLNGVFETAQRLATHSILCYANADIILMSDFVAALPYLPAEPFLLIGRRWEVDITEPIDFDRPHWEAELRRRVVDTGRLRGPAAMDYFVFRRGQIPKLLPFAVGRVGWDSWMVYRMCTDRAMVIDSTPAIMAVHQNHEYVCIGSSKYSITYFGPEAKKNCALAQSAGMVNAFTVEHANRVLTHRGVARPPLTRERLSCHVERLALHSPMWSYIARGSRLIGSPRAWPSVVARLGRRMSYRFKALLGSRCT